MTIQRTGKHHRSRRFHYGDMLWAYVMGLGSGMGVLYIMAIHLEVWKR